LTLTPLAGRSEQRIKSEDSKPFCYSKAGGRRTDIDTIVERRFQHVRPRWEDRPAVWERLLLTAESEDLRKTRDFNLYSLQLVTGELWMSTDWSSE